MKLINHTYHNQNKLEKFIESNQLTNTKNILIQIFTPSRDKQFIEKLIDTILNNIPKAKIIGATTSFEISTKGLHENETIISFSKFKETLIKTYYIEGNDNSFKIGKKLINQLENPNDISIKTAFCFSNKKNINGDELLNGINSINSSLIIAGGIAGDYVTYHKSFVFTENIILEDGTILATLKNPNLQVFTEQNFNWDTIGKKHIITKSIKNRVYEIDNMTTLEFYKRYLGENIDEDIINTCFGIPLIIEKERINIGRGIYLLHDDESISYSGNVNEGDSIRFGYGNTNLILEKSKQSILKLKDKDIEGFYIYSCLGRRKAFMSKSIDIEIEQHNKIAPMCGFLTHGEFFHGNIKSCKNRFLNQTMTVLALSELEEKPIKEKQEQTIISKEYKKYLALNNLISKTSSELEDLTNNLEKRVSEEVKKNEEQEVLLNLTQAQAEVGYMLEMIAHQWRQPLSGISTIASTLRLKNDLDNLTKDEITYLAKDILDFASFANGTIEDFRALFKAKQKYEKIEIKNLINKVKNILKSLLAKNSINLKETYICDEKSELCIPLGQTLQVFINIINNAVDAIIENKIENPSINLHVKKNEDNYSIIIEDNAGGVPEEILPKIFNKRFSTKQEDVGTGLGLDICKSIIQKKLNGSINASNGEHGAIFEIEIPNNIFP